MKFVTSLTLIIFFYFANVANSNEFYIKALKEAALSNGFQKPEEINSLFDKEKSELGNKLFHDELLSLNSPKLISSDFGRDLLISFCVIDPHRQFSGKIYLLLFLSLFEESTETTCGITSPAL